MVENYIIGRMLFIQNMLHNIACHFISVTNTAIDKIEEELMLQLNKALAYHWIMQKIIEKGECRGYGSEDSDKIEKDSCTYQD